MSVQASQLNQAGLRLVYGSGSRPQPAPAAEGAGNPAQGLHSAEPGAGIARSHTPASASDVRAAQVVDRVDLRSSAGAAKPGRLVAARVSAGIDFSGPRPEPAAATPLDAARKASAARAPRPAGAALVSPAAASPASQNAPLPFYAHPADRVASQTQRVAAVGTRLDTLA